MRLVTRRSGNPCWQSTSFTCSARLSTAPEPTLSSIDASGSSRASHSSLTSRSSASPMVHTTTATSVTGPHSAPIRGMVSVSRSISSACAPAPATGTQHATARGAMSRAPSASASSSSARTSGLATSRPFLYPWKRRTSSGSMASGRSVRTWSARGRLTSCVGFERPRRSGGCARDQSRSRRPRCCSPPPAAPGTRAPSARDPARSARGRRW